MPEFTVNASQLRTLASDLKKISPALQQDLYKGLVEAGEIVASDARRRAAAGAGGTKGSKRIPPSIKVRRNRTNVRVQAGGARAPHAAALDHQGLGGTFRHPVFGNRDNWVNQSAVPFLEPAGRANASKVADLIVLRISQTLAKVGI